MERIETMADKPKDAFNRNNQNNQSNKPQENAKQHDKEKPNDDQNQDKNGSQQPESGPPTKMEKFKNTAKKAGKNAAKNALRNSDSETGKLYRAYEKTKNAIKKTKKYMNWLVRYVQFCISNPIGWICGILTLVFLFGVAADVAQSLSPDELGMGGTGDYNSSLVAENTDGEKTTLLLIDCGPRSISKTKSGSDIAADADWTKEGTRAYKNAKDLFDAWVNVGLSGEAAAGILGWVNSEGGFDIIGRAEGHYGGGDSNSIAHGAVPIPTGNYPVGGGGIYQFTPYTKYAPLNDPKWEDGKAMTEFVISELPGAWSPQVGNLMHDMTGTPHTFEQFAQETDPAQATLMWNSYEKGDQNYVNKDQKQRDARKANEVFNKAGHKFDKSKFDKQFGSGSSSNGSTNSTSTQGKKVQCKPSHKGGGDGWQAKGGSHRFSNGQGWKPEELPEELRQYAIDPKSLGMEYNDQTGWEPVVPHSKMYDQCTALSAVLMHHLWEKDGKHPTQLMGNGIDVVANWVRVYGGESTTEPVSGSVFSSDGVNAYGHTGVVSHVFDDGSILIIEQNCTGLSGESIGKRFTWDYRIVSASTLASEHYKFYNPADRGFTINPNAKSL